MRGGGVLLLSAICSNTLRNCHILIFSICHLQAFPNREDHVWLDIPIPIISSRWLDANPWEAKMTNEQIMRTSQAAKHRCSPSTTTRPDAAPTHLTFVPIYPRHHLFKVWKFGSLCAPLSVTLWAAAAIATNVASRDQHLLAILPPMGFALDRVRQCWVHFWTAVVGGCASFGATGRARQDPGHATGENGCCAGFELRSRLWLWCGKVFEDSMPAQLC